MNAAGGVSVPELLRAWRRRRLAVGLWLAAAVAVLAHGAVLLSRSGSAAAVLAGLGVFAVGGILAWIAALPRSDDAARLALHLDRVVPGLQESGELLVRDAESPLGALQRRRALEALPGAGVGDLWPRAALRRARIALGIALLLAVGMGVAGQRRERAAAGAPPPTPPLGSPVPAAPSLEDVVVVISPPSYTGRPERRSAALDLEAEEGASVRWQVRARDAAGGVLEFDDGALALERGPDGTLSAARSVFESRVYALVLHPAPAGGAERAAPEFRSPFARLAVLVDRPPSVAIERPPALSTVEPGALGTLRVEVLAGDDHGLAEVDLVATVARGAGEQVEFRAERLSLTPLPRAPEAGGARRFGRTLDLAGLGLVAGSELYLQAEARDRRPPRPNLAQSEAVRVRVAGGGPPSAALDSGLPPIHVEASLRSQRQLIADTERLLAEQSRLSVAEFERRSTEIGFDQRALRLRYGALLGEEFESGAPAGAEGPESGEHGDAAAAPDESADVAAAQALLDEFVHHHDSQEVATFFDDPQRARMKAALGEMWGAEGKLRLGDPRGALPFEYRALRHLKTAQEQSRVYVAKLGSELPRLDLAKRLSGDLEGIASRGVRLAAPPAPRSPVLAALAAVAALRQQPTGSVSTAEGGEAGDRDARAAAAEALEAVASSLARAAASGEAAALAGLDALAGVRAALESDEALDLRQVERLERGLAVLLPVPPAVPAPRDPAGDLGLAYQRALRGDGP